MYLDAIQRGGVAVVTGGASGVGRVAVERFAGAGLTVVIADLPGDALDAAVIAPCTMDCLSRLATGRTDDVVCLILSAVDRSKLGG